MGKHTKFESSDDESDRKVSKKTKEKKTNFKEENREKDGNRDRDRSPHKHRHREEKRDRHRDNNRYEGQNQKYRSDRQDDYKNFRRRDDKDNKDNRRDRNQANNRLSQEEIQAQRKALWGNKSKESTNSAEEQVQSADLPTSSSNSGKNEKLWSSAIAATGVDESQANKFMRLMGVKSAPKPTEDSSNLNNEKQRQTKMLSDLEKQYAVARVTTHMGRGTGLGFH